jgi:hypothetical protein
MAGNLSAQARVKGFWERQRGVGLALGLLSLVVYTLLGPNQDNTSSFPPLADAFLHGRDWLAAARPWDELALRAAGGFYVPFPPFPALALVPFVAVLGLDRVDINWTVALFGALAVWQTYGLLGDLRVRARDAFVLTLSFALGSEFFYVAATGGHHHLPMAIAVFAMTAALRLGLRRRWPVLAGLLLGAAIASRPPVAFTLPLFFYLYTIDFWPLLARARQRGAVIAHLFLRWALLAAPLILTAILVGAYNDAHFGSPLNFGYDLIISGNDQLTRCTVGCAYPALSPWFTNGIESIAYIPRSLYYMLASGFNIIDSFPFLKPSWYGLSLLLVMPSLLWVFRAPWRDRLARVAGAALVLGLLPDLAHGSWGFAQVGYRFILDVLPIAMLLIGLAVARHGLSKWLAAALMFGAAVTWYVTIASWVGFISY